MNLTNYDMAILFGLVLGDGYIDPRGQIQVKHCERQKEYCIYKAKLLHSVCGGKDIKILETIIDGTKKGLNKVEYKNYGFKKQSKHFKCIREMLYPKNKKVITQKVLEYLSPLSIALWWMDDGNLTRKTQKDGTPGPYALRFYTYLSKEENELIASYFKNNYNMQWNVTRVSGDKTNTLFMLQCGQTEGRKFLNIVRPIVLKVPCMAYKVIDI